MKVSKETVETINMVQEFLRELSQKELKQAEENGEIIFSGHLGNMIFKLNLVKKELEIKDNDE